MRRIDFKEIGEIRTWLKEADYTKKEMIEKVAPFRDKYNLTDGLALRILRDDISISAIILTINLCNPDKSWIKHEWEEDNGHLIDNFECPYCHTWKREASKYCPDCGEEVNYGD